MRLLIISSLIVLSGCASGGMKAGCGHVDGNEVTIPYVGGKANGNAYGCYMGCVGKCPMPDYTAMQTLLSQYIKETSNNITTTVPMTVTLSPSK